MLSVRLASSPATWTARLERGAHIPFLLLRCKLLLRVNTDSHRSSVRRLINGKIYEMEISDPDRLEPRGQTAGRESACIVVYDIADKVTLCISTKSLSSSKPSFDNAPYWLKSARNFAPHNRILCAAKSDLVTARVRSESRCTRKLTCSLRL